MSTESKVDKLNRWQYRAIRYDEVRLDDVVPEHGSVNKIVYGPGMESGWVLEADEVLLFCGGRRGSQRKATADNPIIVGRLSWPAPSGETVA